jgi:hypothetical protein
MQLSSVRSSKRVRNCAAGGRVLAHSISFRHRNIGDMFPQTLTNIAVSAKIGRVLPKSGPVAQLGARFHGMEEVIGSIPIRSTNSPTTYCGTGRYRERQPAWKGHLSEKVWKRSRELLCPRRNGQKPSPKDSTVDGICPGPQNRHNATHHDGVDEVELILAAGDDEHAHLHKARQRRAIGRQEAKAEAQRRYGKSHENPGRSHQSPV